MIYQTHVSNKHGAYSSRHYAATLVRKKVSICAPVSVQSLSKLATTAFMNGSESAMARSLSPRPKLQWLEWRLGDRCEWRCVRIEPDYPVQEMSMTIMPGLVALLGAQGDDLSTRPRP